MTKVIKPLSVVTIQAGNRYKDFYVDRLKAMVERNLPLPIEFTCWTDNPRPGRFHPSIRVRDLSSWKLEGFFNKLRLFDPEVGGDSPFLFLDLTMVIRSTLTPLIEIAQRTDASLVGVPDWKYPTVNSSVMWVRPDHHTREVWDAWARGDRFHGHMPGDQDFIDAVFKANSPEALAYWPAPLVASYRGLRKLARIDPSRALDALAHAVIVKFHGNPRPDAVLDPRRHLTSTVLRYPLNPRLWRYLSDEIEAHWHAEDLADSSSAS